MPRIEGEVALSQLLAVGLGLTEQAAVVRCNGMRWVWVVEVLSWIIVAM